MVSGGVLAVGWGNRSLKVGLRHVGCVRAVKKVIIPFGYKNSSRRITGKACSTTRLMKRKTHSEDIPDILFYTII